MNTFTDAHLDALVVPKASAADIFQLGEFMDDLGFSSDIELWLMAETPAVLCT